jgi:hypothetical protein
MFQRCATIVLLFSSSATLFAGDPKDVSVIRIPFEFTVVGHRLPPGKYFAWHKSRKTVLMWSAATPQVIEMSAAPILRAEVTQEPKVFLLEKDGNKRFWRYFPAGSPNGFEVAVPGMEIHTNGGISRVTFVSDKQSLSREFFAGRSHRRAQPAPGQQEVLINHKSQGRSLY